MNESHPDQHDAIPVEFLDRLLDDIQDGRVRSVGDYEKLFPGHAGVIASELARVAVESDATSLTGFPLSADDAEALREKVTRLREQSHAAERYVERDEVGRGGMARVMRVFDVNLRRELAMKVALSRHPGALIEDPGRLARFLDEAQVAAQLNHPGIVPVYDVGARDDGSVYFTMRLVKGEHFGRVIERVHEGDPSWSRVRALQALLRVCETMAYAHDRGVIHRDLKPTNVMVGRFGAVYVMDWGLARVTGRPDLHDMRFRSGELYTATRIATDRQAAEDDSDSPIYTMDGAVVGTPRYMAPEQAGGEIERVDERADVYAVGAMLYQLLAGRAPYAPDEGAARLSAHMLLARVIQGPPTPLGQLAPETPEELEAICQKAMAREPEQRYATMLELADDLRAYLEVRVVRAHRTGALVELRKWVRRNRALATTAAVAAGVIVVGSLVAALVLLGLNEDLVLARDSADSARGEAVVSEKRALRLAAPQDLRNLEREADRLWPIRRELVDDYERWLARAEAFVAGLHPNPETGDPGHLAELAAVRARAQVLDATSASPMAAKLDRLEAEVDARRRAARIRTGAEDPGEVAPEPSASFAEHLAATREWTDPNRTVFGKEPAGLGHALAALEAAESDEQWTTAAEALAWGLLASGREDEAFVRIDEACTWLEAPQRIRLETFLETYRMHVDAEEARLTMAERRASVVREEVGDVTYSFADDDDRWWHAHLEALIDSIEAFRDPETGLVAGRSERFGLGIRPRLDQAREIERRTLTGDEARARWARAIRSIADPEECPRYAGLQIVPQLGLLPLERDSGSGLWEFAHVLTGAEPVRGANGRFVVADDTCLVLVLVPGGTFGMGAQMLLPEAPGYDPAAELDEDPFHEVTLSPFFLSKYEMTKGQWSRITGSVPPGLRTVSGTMTRTDLALPVAQVSWEMSATMTFRLGLALPSEAQWEYAARAGTTTPWWTGAEAVALAEAANVADRALQLGGGPVGWTYETWVDGYANAASVGSLTPNAFGLHDVLGNVWELCQDGYGVDYYKLSPRVDPLSDPEFAAYRVQRGGGFNSFANSCRASSRSELTPFYRHVTTGLRPARALER